MPLPLGIVVAGKYRIEEILGQGGMGLVVRATHLQLGEPVALKFLHVDLAQDARHVERFLREARAQARIKSTDPAWRGCTTSARSRTESRSWSWSSWSETISTT